MDCIGEFRRSRLLAGLFNSHPTEATVRSILSRLSRDGVHAPSLFFCVNLQRDSNHHDFLNPTHGSGSVRSSPTYIRAAVEARLNPTHGSGSVRSCPTYGRALLNGAPTKSLGELNQVHRLDMNEPTHFRGWDSDDRGGSSL